MGELGKTIVERDMTVRRPSGDAEISFSLIDGKLEGHADGKKEDLIILLDLINKIIG